MAEEAGEERQPTANQITFNVKSGSDSKYVITVSEDTTVRDLKQKLATTEFADVPPERQRLIYSGRVLKDIDQLVVYKIKDGNTVHLVKGAASNQRQAPAAQTGSSSVIPGAGTPASNVPSNFQTGTGTDPLSGLTGARYAGFAQLPGADQFGPDGGMGAPQGPEEMLSMLENPMFQSQMNEAMNNPHVIQMMQNSPAVRNNPWLRQMLENPEVRRMMMDPNVIRQSMQMSRMNVGGAGMGGFGGNAMPAPGVTDTTPQSQTPGTGSTTAGAPNNTSSPPPPNPFGMFGGMGGPDLGAQGNPFAALFGGGGSPFGAPPQQPPQQGNNTTTTSTTETRSTDGQSGAPPGGSGTGQQPAPFGNLFGMMSQLSQTQGQGQGQGQGALQGNAFQNLAQQKMQNPQMMQAAMQMMNSMGSPGGGAGAGLGAGAGAGTGNTEGGQQPNPFANLFGPGGGFGMGSTPPAPQDTRPPEEQYAEQLRQLNDMGFYEFERNVRALRMAGGNVQGAVQFLLDGGP